MSTVKKISGIEKWASSLEDLIEDPVGLQEFMNYLEKEYSLENIRFWLAVNEFKRASESEILQKSKQIFDEFLVPGSPCEINIDGKTKEKIHQEIKKPSKFIFDHAAKHVYSFLLKNDCYPRFIRSEHYKNLLVNGIDASAKRRMFVVFDGCSNKDCDLKNTEGSCLQKFFNQSSSNNAKKKSDNKSNSNASQAVLNTVLVQQYYSHYNITDNDEPSGDNSLSSPAVAVDDVCPWESACDSNNLSVPSTAGQNRGRDRLSVSLSWSSVHSPKARGDGYEPSSYIYDGTSSSSNESRSGLTGSRPPRRNCCSDGYRHRGWSASRAQQRTTDDSDPGKTSPLLGKLKSLTVGKRRQNVLRLSTSLSSVQDVKPVGGNKSLKSLTPLTKKKSVAPTINVTGPVMAGFVSAAALAVAPVAVDEAIAMENAVAVGKTVVTDQATVFGVTVPVVLDKVVAVDEVVTVDKTVLAAADGAAASVTVVEMADTVEGEVGVAKKTDATERAGGSGGKVSQAKDS